MTYLMMPNVNGCWIIGVVYGRAMEIVAGLATDTPELLEAKLSNARRSVRERG
jgi:hypothetical protein